MRFNVPIILILVLSPVALQMIGESTYFTSYAANAIFRNNFHEVVPGRMYRSAQMSRSDLEEVIRANKIKSVIDLRLDEDSPDETGRSESEAAGAAGAAYRHIPFSSRRADQQESILRLLKAYSEMPPPFLVHCSSGTHRSGVAAAIWLLQNERGDTARAAEQLTMKYGFFQLERDLKAFFQNSPTLDHVISEYLAAQSKGPISFHDWVLSAEIVKASNSNAARSPETLH